MVLANIEKQRETNACLDRRRNRVTTLGTAVKWPKPGNARRHRKVTSTDCPSGDYWCFINGSRSKTICKTLYLAKSLYRFQLSPELSEANSAAFVEADAAITQFYHV